jgi:hypothetical protein
MRIRKRILAMAAAVLLAVGLSTFMTANPAFAVNGGICGSGGNGNCLNAWFGGPPVYIYLPNKSNEDFYLESVGYCEGGSRVLSTAFNDNENCPFTDADLDEQYWNSPIVQIVYAPTSTCVANQTGGDTAAGLNTCANIANGGGGGQGVIQVLATDQGCSGSYEGLIINNYWTNVNNGGNGLLNEIFGLEGGVPSGGSESLASLNIGCWGGTGFIVSS